MKNVLVVDDSSVVRSLLKSELEKYDNIKVYFAKSYAQAEKLMDDVNFHVALLDLNLPDAENGEVVQLADTHEIPSVILTATANEALKSFVLKTNVLDFVYKSEPSSIKFAVQAISRTLKNYDATVLVVDDSSTYRFALRKILRKNHLNILEAKDGEDALKVLAENSQISLVITDYEMPKMDGHALTFKIRESYKKDSLAIIAVSSFDKQDTITKFLRYGANDFIHKPFEDNEIVTRVNSNLDTLELFEKIKCMANRDFLTGLSNRRHFFEMAKPIFARNQRKKHSVAVAMIDIDKFKNVNDTYGHDVGDIAIKEVAKILNSNLRESDVISRFGGEEFCILLEDIDEENTKKLFEKIRIIFEENEIVFPDFILKYTVSTGICYGLSKNFDELIKASDEALYDAKENGRNRVTLSCL